MTTDRRERTDEEIRADRAEMQHAGAGRWHLIAARLANDVESLMAARDEALAKLAEVERLHFPYDCTEAGKPEHETCGDREWCYSCRSELRVADRPRVGRCAGCHERRLPPGRKRIGPCCSRCSVAAGDAVTSEGRYSYTDARALWFCTVCGAVVPVEARGVHDGWHERLGLPAAARCDDRAPTLMPGGPSWFCVRERGHLGWHEAETEGFGRAPMRWIADGHRTRPGPSLQGTGETP